QPFYAAALATFRVFHSERSDEPTFTSGGPCLLAFGVQVVLSPRPPTAESLEPKASSPNPKVTSGLTFFQSHHLDDHPLLPSPVELGIEHLFPWSEIECAVGDRQHDLVPHDRALEMRVGIVFAGLMVAIIETGRRELLEPCLEIVNQS